MLSLRPDIWLLTLPATPAFPAKRRLRAHLLFYRLDYAGLQAQANTGEGRGKQLHGTGSKALAVSYFDRIYLPLFRRPRTSKTLKLKGGERKDESSGDGLRRHLLFTHLASLMEYTKTLKKTRRPETMVATAGDQD